MRAKTILSLMLVATGTALAVAGPGAFRTAAMTLWEAGPVLLLVLGGSAFLRAIAPSTVELIMPAALLLAGAALIAVRTGAIPAGLGLRYGSATLAVIVGILLAREPRNVIDLRRRRWSVLGRRTVGAVEVPARIRAVAVASRLILDLSSARSQDVTIECFFSSWYGAIELHLPYGWLVVSGRVDAARFVNLKGQLDDAESYADPSSPETREALANLRAERGGQVVVVVHVLGTGGQVHVQRSSA